MRYVLICLALAGGYFVLQKINHRDGVADFRVYYDAASAWINGTSPYGQAFGVSSGFYKYSPVALLPFTTLCLLPYPLASGIYYFIVLLAFILFSLILVRFLEGRFGFPTHCRGWVLATMTIFLADHFERELHLGNVNVFLLIAAFLLHELIRKQKLAGAGLLYAAMLLVKPHFAILLPYFIWKGQWRLVRAMGAGLIAGLCLPAIVSGWNGNIQLHQEWITAIQDHNTRLSESPNTIYGIINAWVLSPLGMHADSALVIVGLACTALAFLWILLKNKNGEPDQSRFFEFFILIALIPNLTHTDTEHFMWTWPLIAFVWMTIFYRQFANKRLVILLLVLAFIPYTINSPDLVGKKVMRLFDEGGLLGMANLLILGVALYLFYATTRSVKPTSDTGIAS